MTALKKICVAVCLFCVTGSLSVLFAFDISSSLDGGTTSGYGMDSTPDEGIGDTRGSFPRMQTPVNDTQLITDLSTWGAFIAPSQIPLPNAQLALSEPDYRVTPGDVYQVSYAAGERLVNYLITVDHSYQVRVSNLGIINVRNMTSLGFKQHVENIVTKNYPLSGVQFALVQPATFTVYITGEVEAAEEVTAWARTRVSHALCQHLTEYSSIRDVVIHSIDGSSKKVDLFKAKREGDLSQDPFLRPGDRLAVNRLLRAVTMKGEVERPGTYQLLEGENLQELVKLYGKGLTPYADSTRLELVRINDQEHRAGTKSFLNDDDIASNTPLLDSDIIVIPKRTELRPVVFVEGAIGIDTGTTIEASSRKAIQFTPGENYGPLVRSIAKLITPTSDTANAYILRDGALIALDLNPLLYNADYHSEELVKPNDRLVIPFKQYFVSVSGAVLMPGRYPYIPDRPIEYYIGLAGGFDPQKNKNGRVLVQDMLGKTIKPGEQIAPEFNIHAETNAFLYYFKEYAPVITTILSLTTTALTVYGTFF